MEPSAIEVTKLCWYVTRRNHFCVKLLDFTVVKWSKSQIKTSKFYFTFLTMKRFFGILYFRITTFYLEPPEIYELIAGYIIANKIFLIEWEFVWLLNWFSNGSHIKMITIKKKKKINHKTIHSKRNNLYILNVFFNLYIS